MKQTGGQAASGTGYRDAEPARAEPACGEPSCAEPACAEPAWDGWSSIGWEEQRAVVRRAIADGEVDALLGDTDFLVHAHPDLIIPLLYRAGGETARRAAAVYRASLHHLDRDVGVRRWLLGLHAHRAGMLDLVTPVEWSGSAPARIDIDRSGQAPWPVLWSNGARIDPRRLWVLTGHTGAVIAVATATLDGRPVAVTASDDRTVRVWDLATGRQIAAFPQISPVRAVAAVEVGGRAAILAAAGRWLRLTDPVTGGRIGPIMAGHTQTITALTTLTRHDKTIAVSGSDDHTIRSWDLTNGRQIGPALPFPNPIIALTATPDGFVVCHGTEITLLAAADGRPACSTPAT